MAELTKAIARLMEERERSQQASPVSSDPPKLRDVLDLLRAKLAPGERAMAETLARQLFDRAGAELLAAGRAADLSTTALAIFRFLSERSVNEPRVVVRAPADEGWENPTWVVQTWMRDRPFIVDTVLDTLRAAGTTVQRLVHPIFTVERDQRGTLLGISAPGDYGRRESVLYAEVDRVTDAARLTQELTERLTHVVHATDDYQPMRHKAQEIADELRNGSLPRPWNADVDELAAFLDWLGEKNFVFLGYREYQFSNQGSERLAAVRPDSGLGLLRDETRSHYATLQPLPDQLRRRLSEPPLHMMSKTNAESPIHRREHMEYIGIKEVDATGIVTGERRLLGLFTARAYAQEPMSVPLLRLKLAAILDAEGAPEESHSYKQIVASFNSLTRVELLALGVPQLRDIIKTIVGAFGSGDIRVVQHMDALGRGAFVVVTIPKERFSADLSHQIESRLMQLLGAQTVLEQRLVVDDNDQVRLHFYFAPHGESVRQVPADELRLQLQGLLRTWDDRLRDALLESMPRDQARELARRYAAVVSPQYKASTDVSAAVTDIAHLEALIATRTPQIDFINPAPAIGSAQPRFTVLKLYLADEELVLSDFLPVLENLGLKVFAQDPIDLQLPNIGAVRIHSFFVQDRHGARLDVEKAAALVKPALLLLYRGRLDNDALNALILSAELDWRQVDLLRTYVNHAVQVSTATSREAIANALVLHPAASHALWEYFDTRFNPIEPASPREREKIRLPEVAARFVGSLDAVESAGYDRILRCILDAMAATVRTNYYRSGVSNSEPAPLSIKLDCRLLPRLPQPQPVYEIYMHSLDVEGVHLRGAKVARGGIRYSDRLDDFRTEILDLMTTQMVKNAVIIPAGAKGGFVIKRRPGINPSAAQIVAGYRSFISTLLDLTDNIVQGRIESPPGLLLYDDLDPYLVVAADKGTASFSDIGNEIAMQRKFWLGDAFASGGSQGYDHKKIGITARGAWECVKRHLREIGRDAERDAITVIGIGDMSGDVFGNGLLLSRHFQLRAAFNHQHIFLDPNPDPARSFTERERLFRLPRSSWADYNTALLSEGGGIFPRTAKRIALPQPLRALLGIEHAEASGDEVVRAILRMEADLLWNGGIGTYVKAADETDLMAGDSSNDAVRVDGRDLRVRIVAEGGNLGLTQRGRVEYALLGGRLNTDAIDNSAGVDMSDHEVNLKICLANAQDTGVLGNAERNQLLSELEPDVSARVLAHNRRQARAISLDQGRSQTRLDMFREHIVALENDKQLDRRLAGLPDRETLRSRRAGFLGLTRPELAVLLAHSKLALQQQLLASALPDDPFFERFLRGYFAEIVNQRFGLAVRSHRLRREIIAVEVANNLIDMMGMTFAPRIARDTGTTAAAAVRAWSIVSAVSGLAELWHDIVEASPPLPLAAETACAMAIESSIERATKWFLETQPSDVPAAEMLEALTHPTRDLLPLLPEVLPAEARSEFNASIEALAAEGTPRALATRVVLLERLGEIFEIAEVAAGLELERETVAQTYHRAGELLDIDWLQRALSQHPSEDRWERRAVQELTRGLATVRRQMTVSMLAQRGSSVDACLQEYSVAHAVELAAASDLIRDIKATRRPSLAALVVAVRELTRLVEQPAG